MHSFKDHSHTVSEKMQIPHQKRVIIPVPAPDAYQSKKKEKKSFVQDLVKACIGHINLELSLWSVDKEHKWVR